MIHFLLPITILLVLSSSTLLNGEEKDDILIRQVTSEDDDRLLLRHHVGKGHTIPLLHLSHLLRRHHLARITFLTTPLNAPFIRAHADATADIIPLPFPDDTFPDSIQSGIELTDQLPSISLFLPFAAATKHLHPRFEHVISSLLPDVTFLISDGFLWWTLESALKLEIPRAIFYGMGMFAMAVNNIVSTHRPQAGIASQDQPFTVPESPVRLPLQPKSPIQPCFVVASDRAVTGSPARSPEDEAKESPARSLLRDAKKAEAVHQKERSFSSVSSFQSPHRDLENPTASNAFSSPMTGGRRKRGRTEEVMERKKRDWRRRNGRGATTATRKAEEEKDFEEEDFEEVEEQRRKKRMERKAGWEKEWEEMQ